MAFVFNTIKTSTSATATEAQVWIEADSAHYKIVDASKLDTIYVEYKGPSKYAVIGAIGDRTILLKMLTCESDAQEWAKVLMDKLS